MKRRIKTIAICLLAGMALSSCAVFGERKRCPAYSQAENVNTPTATKDSVRI